MTEPEASDFHQTIISEFTHNGRVWRGEESVPGRGGVMHILTPRNALAQREEARDSLYILIDQLRPLLPRTLVDEVEAVANDIGVCEWSLAASRMWAGYAPEVEHPGVLLIEPEEAETHPRSEFRSESDHKSRRAPLTDRTRRRVWRVAAGLVVAFAVGVLIGQGWRQ